MVYIYFLYAEVHTNAVYKSIPTFNSPPLLSPPPPMLSHSTPLSPPPPSHTHARAGLTAPSPGTVAQAHRLALASVLTRELATALAREQQLSQHILSLDRVRGMVQQGAWAVR